MDSRSRKLPFCLSSSRSSYTVSSPSVSSPLGSGGRLYGRESALNRDRLPRASSPYKPDLDKQTFHLLGSSRDHGGPETRSPSWKLPSLAASSRSYERPWAESPLSSRSKAAEGRLGGSSALLDSSDDAESKRAKLSYTSRGLYSRTPGASAAGSAYCGVREPSGTDESLGSSWTSYRLLSRPSSSKTLLSSRDQETKNETSWSRLGEGRVRSPGRTSSLYQTDRVTSTYAQGARPKETTSSSSSSRESTLNQVFLSSSSSSSSSQRSAPRSPDFSVGTSSRFRSGSSLLSSQEQTRSPDSSSSSSSRAHLYSTPVVRSPPTRLTSDVREPEGRSSTRRLLSRLFSRRSSQDSSSGSSSSRSQEDDSPSTSGESVDDEDGAGTAGADPDVAEPTSNGVRSRRADPSPDRDHDGYRSAGRRGTALWREPAAAAGGGGGGRSWLSSSLRGRCPPLLSRLRRYTREDGAAATPTPEDRHPQRLHRWWEEPKTSQAEDEDEDEDDEDDDDDYEEEEGAVGVDSLCAGPDRRLETVPELEDPSPSFLLRRRFDRFGLVSLGSNQNQTQTQTQNETEKTESSSNQEKLRRIKEKLLLEDSDEEEGDLCRICQMREDGSSSNPLIQPCRCTGSLQFVHQDCIKRWLRSKISSGSNLEAITTCELCKDKLRLNIDNFDINELYWEHEQSEYDELISSGLYLVVLLRFYEQRFSDVLRVVDAAGLFNLARTLHEYMDNLETPDGESDDERRDGRPSVDFSDLDDDPEEEY